MKLNSPALTTAVAMLAYGVIAGVLRFSCLQLVVDRLDPLVNPGQLPSPHLHQIVGGVRHASSVPFQSTSLND